MNDKEMDEKDVKKLLKKQPAYREEANALICECLRNGFIEDLHARITDEEMKKLMIETTAKLAIYLEMKDENPKLYKKFINFMTLTYTHDWSLDLTEYNIKSR
jgi:hypothetical protein